MAKKFATSLKLPYKGTIANYPVQYCGGAKALPFYFPWRQYGTYLGAARNTAINPGVQFTSSNPPTQVLSSVQGVFIDNTDCASPVYLQCEDTGHMVACADNATAYFPLMTSGTNFTLYIETVDGPYQRDQQTNVFLLDKAVPPFLQGQASNRFVSLAQISGQEAFSTDFLADKIISRTYTRNNAGAFDIIIPAAPNRTFIVQSISCAPISGDYTGTGTGSLRVDFYRGSAIIFTGGASIVGTANGATLMGASTSTGPLAYRILENQNLQVFVTATGNSATPSLTITLTGTEITNPTS